MDPDPGSLTHILLQSPAIESSGFFANYGLFLAIILVLILISALVSGTEVAFFSLNKVDLEEFLEEGSRGQKTAISLLKKPRRLLASILITNNLVNVGIVLLSTFMLQKMGVEYGWREGTFGKYFLPLIEVSFITFVLLFFGEITPKIYASQNKKRIASIMALPLNFLVTILIPFTFLLTRSTRFLDKRIKVENEIASFQDIKNAIDLTSEEESPDEEKEILKGIVDFSNTPVKAIMRARVDIKAVSIRLNFQQLLANVNDFGYSRVPVYEDNPDNIKGILYLKDLLPLLQAKEENPDWRNLVRSPFYIPESKKIHDLLEEFKQLRLHIAIVVDEFGGTAGLVTLEDIIEQIFGEINDEFDDDEQVYSKLSDTEYIFDGKISLHDLVKITDIESGLLEDIKGDADSLAGMVLEIHGKIPSPGEIIESDHFRFHIESVSRKRISRIKFVILNQEETSDENE